MLSLNICFEVGVLKNILKWAKDEHFEETLFLSDHETATIFSTLTKYYEEKILIGNKCNLVS